MKRVLLLIGLPLLVAVVLFLLVLDQGTGSNTLVVQEGSFDTAAPTTTDLGETDRTSPADNRQAGYPLAPPDARAASVERLADGDSFDIRWTDTNESDEVRLFGLNAPEANACFGTDARELLQSLTGDSELRIESIGRDDFGRVLGNVWVGDVFINIQMVEMGGALALSDGGNHAALIQDAQEFASINNIGLWDPEFCGADLDANIVIVAIEADAPGRDNLNPNGEWIDIVNLTDSDADMTDWSIRDESTRHRFFFPDDFVLASGGGVRVFSGCGDDDTQSLYWCDGDPVWNNGGDTGFLVDPEGRFADSLSYDG